MIGVNRVGRALDLDHELPRLVASKLSTHLSDSVRRLLYNVPGMFHFWGVVLHRSGQHVLTKVLLP